MMSISGNSDPHLHSQCPRCGYATRFKQWPIRCACNRYDSKPFTFPWENDPAWPEKIRQANQRVAEHQRSQGTQ
jgi:hypothetical protein